VFNRSSRSYNAARMRRFGILQPAHRDLGSPVLGWEKAETARPGIHGAPVDVPACLIGLTSVESRGLQSDFAVRDASGEDVVGDVSGILPVVTDGGLGQLERARSLREGHRSQSWVADRSVVNVPGALFTQRVRILNAQLHHEI